MSTINVPIVALKALLNVAGDKDIRYYLNGVKVEATNKETRLITTNGHMVAVYRDNVGNEGIPAGVAVEFIIARDTIKALAVIKGVPYVQIEPGDIAADGSTDIVMTYGASSVKTRTVDGRFPAYQRVIPSECTGEAATFIPLCLVAIQKIFKAVRGGKTGWYELDYNGSGGAIAHDGGDDLVVVIMPIRRKHEDVKPIHFAWARKHINPVPEALAA